MELLFIIQGLLSFFLVVPFYLYFCYHTTAARKKIIGNGVLTDYTLIGCLPGAIKNKHRVLEWTSEILAASPTKTATFRRPGLPTQVLTANPSNVEHILKTRFDRYPKGKRFISLLHDVFGDGLFTVDGELWQVQRKMVSYEFNTNLLRNFAMDNVALENRTRLLPLLRNVSRTGQVLDLQKVLEVFAFDNICKMAFNVDPGLLRDEEVTTSNFTRAFNKAASLSVSRLHRLPFMWKVAKILNVGMERELRNCVSNVHEYMENIIRSRLAEEKGTNKDLLSRLIDQGITSTGYLRDIAISAVLAGKDTTSTALTWFFWLLSSHPIVEKRILEEIETIRTRHNKTSQDTYSFEELREMNYLHAALTETMRLYPPVPQDGREALMDDVLPDGTFVRKGWRVIYSSYAMGRMESLWGKNSLEYLPERWLDENGVFKPESPCRFPVFHAGPRICLGKDLAYIQMKSIVASVLERFEIEAQNKGKCPGKIPSMTLLMEGGLPVKVKERRQHTQQ